MGEMNVAERGGSVTVKNAWVAEAAVVAAALYLTAAIFDAVEGGEDTDPETEHLRTTPDRF